MSNGCAKQKSEFSEAIKKAEAESRDTGKEFAIKAIFKAMQDGKWQAAAWWLERKFKDEFAARTELGIDGDEIKIPKIKWKRDKKDGTNNEN